MKLLQSTFVAFCVVTGTSAFIVPGAQRTVARPSAGASSAVVPSTTSLLVGIHEPLPGDISDDDIRREDEFRQVLREVSMARDYLDHIVEESCKAAAGVEDEEGPTFAEVLAEKAEEASESGELGLFGGGGDAPAAAAAEDLGDFVYKPALRDDLGSAVLLTGTADATLLATLNNNFFGQDSVPNFNFGTIKALVEDPATAKKRAISREARYGGLLDKLSIEQAEGSLPTATDLEGAGSWIAEVKAEDAAELLPKMAALAKDSDVSNLVVMVTGAVPSSGVDGWDAVTAASGDSFAATLLAVGELHDDAGEVYAHVSDLGKGESDGFDSFATRLPRKRAYQILAHALALDCTEGQALGAAEYPMVAAATLAKPYGEGQFAERDDDDKEILDDMKDVKMEGRMIRAMREAGFTQLMELDVLVEKGLGAFKDFIENPPPERETSWTKTKSARDEEDEKIMAQLDAEIAKSNARKAEEAAEAKGIEIEGIAKEWAIKEYSLRMIGGDLDQSVSEKDFMVSVWDQALAEGEKTYDYIKSDAYVKEQERLEKEKTDIGNKLFWDGMPPLLRKKREKMVEKVKKQYMDLLSEEELERIILND